VRCVCVPDGHRPSEAKDKLSVAVQEAVEVSTSFTRPAANWNGGIDDVNTRFLSCAAIGDLDWEGWNLVGERRRLSPGCLGWATLV